MTNKPRMPKFARRQIKKNKKKREIERVEEFFEAMRKRAKSQGIISEEDQKEMGKIFRDGV